MESRISYVTDNHSEDQCDYTETEEASEQTKKYEVMLIGEHEHQIAEGGESGLPKLWENCKKNPGHPEFIPIESFTMERLPSDYQDNVLYDYIKNRADRTVRLTVTMNSPKRPQFFPNTKDPYYLSDQKGEKTFRTGTGEISNVNYNTRSGPCPCDKCKESGEPSKVWYGIYVHTAAHVVVDDIEARHTTARLFYDREDSPEVILKDNVHAHHVNVIKDQCIMMYVTCDEHLGKKLFELKMAAPDIRLQFWNKYDTTNNNHTLSCIVSHPHGLAKRVSLGHWKNSQIKPIDDDKKGRQFTYTTCTCPGSSGAPVLCVGSYDLLAEIYHMGTMRGINFSGIGVFLERYEEGGFYI